MIKWSIKEEKKTILNLCMSNNTSKYIKQKLRELQGKIKLATK